MWLAIDWVGYLEKPCHGAICRLTLKNLCSPAQKTPTTTAPNPLWCCSNEGHGFYHSRENNSRSLQLVFACSGPNQAHLTNIFWMNVLSNMNSGNGIQLCIFLVGSFQLERCKTRRVVSVGRYQTEPKWFSSCVKSYVGALSLEPSDMSMLHNSCNRYLYIVLYYYIIITPLPTYLPRYLLHMKAGPTLPTSGDSNCFGSDPKLSKFFRSEALHRSSCVDPARCFQEILFKRTGACHWKKFGSKCDAFGADMSSKMSAPGTSCSKETALRIGFMNHHRDCRAQCKIGQQQNEAGRFVYASWLEVLLHVFARKGVVAR